MIPRQSYAPTPHGYVPNTALSATINLDEEVKLTDSRGERDLHDSLAELFSIIITLDELERAFLKDAVAEAEYVEICERSLMQYKSILADETVARAFVGLDEFKAEWELEVPRATERIRVGLPATAVSAAEAAAAASGSASSGRGAHGVVAGGGGVGGARAGAATGAVSGALVSRATEEFITFLDAVKLGMLSKDQLHPLLSDVILSVNRVTSHDFDSRGKIITWLIRLNQMRATQQLDEVQAREVESDINEAYQGFKRTLT